jgi:hypothetical protein
MKRVRDDSSMTNKTITVRNRTIPANDDSTDTNAISASMAKIARICSQSESLRSGTVFETLAAWMISDNSILVAQWQELEAETALKANVNRFCPASAPPTTVFGNGPELIWEILRPPNDFYVRLLCMHATSLCARYLEATEDLAVRTDLTHSSGVVGSGIIGWPIEYRHDRQTAWMSNNGHQSDALQGLQSPVSSITTNSERRQHQGGEWDGSIALHPGQKPKS